jgi:hypothetical protein
MLLAPLLLALAAQAPPPTLARALRASELIAYGRVLRIEARALETAEGKPVRVVRGVQEARLAEVELTRVLKGDATRKKLWLLAQPDNLLYDLDLAEAGAQALLFLTQGEDPTPEGCTYVAKTQDTVWRCALGKHGFAQIEETGGARTIDAPGEKLEAKELEARVKRMVEEQRAVWIQASASGGAGDFPWELALRRDRSATLTIQRAQGPEPHEIWFSNPVMDDIAQKLAGDPPSEKKLELGKEKARGILRSLKVTDGVEIRLQTLEREWLDDPAHKQLARWVVQFYASVRSGIREPGMLDGRKEDREQLR